MCGRFSLGKNTSEILPFLTEHFHLLSTANIQAPRYNIAPGQQVAAVIHDGSQYRVGALQWGLVPSFAKDSNVGYQMINAKTETIFEKPSFKSLILTKRCLILTDGFYEWDAVSGSKKPYFITLKSHPIFAYAGLYSSWTKADGTKLHTTAILTKESKGSIATIHHRMPVILANHNEMKDYLRPNLNDIELIRQFESQPKEAIEMIEVSPWVNSPKNEGPACQEPFESTALKL